eukprot:Sspe_Gene.79759::Locus_50089_Transcript_1_1_Confidence_1.000_Length_376::g.79759::m.79759
MHHPDADTLFRLRSNLYSMVGSLSLRPLPPSCSRTPIVASHEVDLKSRGTSAHPHPHPILPTYSRKQLEDMQPGSVLPHTYTPPHPLSAALLFFLFFSF